MKVILSLILTAILSISLSACGCSNSAVGDMQPPSTTMLPNILPTMETNIPDPDVDTKMPMYTDGTDSTHETDVTLPGIPRSRINK